ncbi:mitochondrial 54S ribosomal protein bL28m [Dipodascopsis tothii]|uniref:mitochondrial 54S ribosomal protein bL28m n=1 Tax=Dipodascopsis tothii TaxID=44089 RepID=UPI0034CF627F
MQYGNNIPESRSKTRRNWRLNILKKSLFSETLRQSIRVKVVASVLRTIRKEGGLDNYLTKDKAARIKQLGPKGWRLRYAVLLEQEKKAASAARRAAAEPKTEAPAAAAAAAAAAPAEPKPVTVGSDLF